VRVRITVRAMFYKMYRVSGLFERNNCVKMAAKAFATVDPPHKHIFLEITYIQQKHRGGNLPEKKWLGSQ